MFEVHIWLARITPTLLRPCARHLAGNWSSVAHLSSSRSVQPRYAFCRYTFCAEVIFKSHQGSKGCFLSNHLPKPGDRWHKLFPFSTKKQVIVSPFQQKPGPCWTSIFLIRPNPIETCDVGAYWSMSAKEKHTHLLGFNNIQSNENSDQKTHLQRVWQTFCYVHSCLLYYISHVFWAMFCF